MKPKRIQRQRTKGWRMPEGAIYVGRPSKWGNPFIVDGSRYPKEKQQAMEMYREWATRLIELAPANLDMFWLAEIRGHDLACWCPLDQPCHADVLLELANA